MRKIRYKKVRRAKLINTGELEYIIELALVSGWIKNAEPLSLIISSKVGAGKTEIIEQYRKVKGVAWLSEATAYGIKSQYLADIKGRNIRHLLIGDLLSPLSKQKHTRDDFVSFMNQLMEEGVSSIHTYAQHWDSKKPVRCGLITTIAMPDFLRKSRRWFEMGFLSRAVPLSYSYSKSTEVKIYRAIARADSLRRIPEKTVQLPEKPVRIVPNKKVNLKIIELSMELGEAENVYGFRRQKQLQTLLMANALKNKRNRVTEEDESRILELSEYINLRFNSI